MTVPDERKHLNQMCKCGHTAGAHSVSGAHRCLDDSACSCEAFEPKEAVPDDLVERVARVLCGDFETMGRVFDARQAQELARAAILETLRAAREPSEEMLRRGFGPFMAAHDPMYSKNEPCGPIYKAMLDQLIKEFSDAKTEGE